MKEILKEKGLESKRAFQGSEDGEAILYRKKGDEEWNFLTHLCPFFVENFDLDSIEDYL